MTDDRHGIRPTTLTVASEDGVAGTGATGAARGRPRTIRVVARGRGRLSRLRLVYQDRNERPTYDAARARELLMRTAELPSRRRELLDMLIEHRHALHDLAVGPGSPSMPGQPVAGRPHCR